MNRGLFLSAGIIISILTAILYPISSGFAQNPTPTPNPQQQDLIAAIEQRAVRDAENENAPQSTQELNLLFGEQAVEVNLTLSEVLEIYENAYSAAKRPELWWQKLLNQIMPFGWVGLIILILWAIFKERLTIIFNFSVDRIYNQLAGTRSLRHWALKKYRQSLQSRYSEIKIPFRTDRPLKMRDIYVPLKVTGTRNTNQFNSYRAIARYKRLMVTGTPGSGKTMLLKSIALAYAEGRLIKLSSQPIPILLELNRLNKSDETLEEHLVRILHMNDFPQAQHFVRLGLKQGTLMLLFDGLDEVNSQDRADVVREIIDLSYTYKKCRIIITCRTAVYYDEFSEIVNQKLEIVEFNDNQIQRFLRFWEPEMGADKSVEHLVRTLNERPKIMALARNPLLLTIIAYLYTDVEFILPHSRTEFYEEATDVLLRQWPQHKKERNHYQAPHKRLVLEYLALFNQDHSVQKSEDRRSIDLQTLISETKQVIPTLNLKPEDAEPIINEIVERSGLLLSIDGGTNFQFAHLTLQEYFAAAALRVR